MSNQHHLWPIVAATLQSVSTEDCLVTTIAACAMGLHEQMGHSTAQSLTAWLYCTYEEHNVGEHKQWLHDGLCKFVFINQSTQPQLTSCLLKSFWPEEG